MDYLTAKKICEQPDRVDGKQDDVPNFVGCRKCSKCLNRHHTDLAGRAMAESLVSDHVFALTLTYGKTGDNRSQFLYYPDFQKMIKRLRFDGYRVRYLVAGEYGSKRGRAHWHACLFFTGKAPPMPPVETEEVHWKYWADVPNVNDKNTNGPVPLGYVFVQKPDFYGVRYVVKYACKDDGSNKTTRKVQMSKAPPLGGAYWSTLAVLDVSAGKPFDFTYMLPDCRFGNGNPVEFYANNASALLKWKAYRAEHIKRFPLKPVLVHERAKRGWIRLVVPAELRAYCAGTRRDIKITPKLGGYLKVRRFGDIALVKLKTGDCVAIAYHGPDKELSLWRVNHLREMIMLARGRQSRTVEQVPWYRVPF